MSLATRVGRLEAVTGTGFGPSERELRQANELLDRYMNVFMLADLPGNNLDPDEIALMRVAKASGQINAAYETRRRYWRAWASTLSGGNKRASPRSIADSPS